MDITAHNRRPTEEILNEIPLSAPTYAPADSRQISRLLNKAGFTRAERLKGTNGQYTSGFHVSDSHVAIFNRLHNEEERAKDKELLRQCVWVLRQHGFVATDDGYVYKQTDPGFSNLHLYQVGWKGELITANRVPSFMAQREEWKHQREQTRINNERKAEARAEARDSFVVALQKSGLTVNKSGYNGLTIDSEDLQAWLEAKGVQVSSS